MEPRNGGGEALVRKADLMYGMTLGYYSTPAPQKVRSLCLAALVNKAVEEGGL